MVRSSPRKYGRLQYQHTTLSKTQSLLGIAGNFLCPQNYRSLTKRSLASSPDAGSLPREDHEGATTAVSQFIPHFLSRIFFSSS
jgi:hypothetical protein